MARKKKLSIRNKLYFEPGVHESADAKLTWLRQNALTSKGKGWFAVGFGAFRRLTRSSQIIVPTISLSDGYRSVLALAERFGLAADPVISR